MTTLMEIQPFIQAYVKAIAAILETDVTVVDNHLIRVAGTGNYEKEIGGTVSHDSFFEKIMTTKKSGMIKSVAEEVLCSVCKKREQCKELASLAYPIFLKENVVGVISIIAFEEQQREILLRKRERLEEFLKYMCVLIESKLSTTASKNKLEQQIRDFTLSEEKYSFVGNSLQMQEALKIASKVAKTNSTVFIRGESGTGKEIMAKMIHSMSSRREHLMISINCAAIPDNLVESELFGYEEGSFTGAKKNGSIGKFELADKSTIFLDEIGDMPLQVQTKLLRVLQEASVERIGGKKPIPIDIRVICATNRNIEKMVEEGTFREDLYYRLNIIPIELPPLRKRKEDIIPLVEYYIDYYNQKLSKNISGISSECKKALLGYRWSGNIRELKNIKRYLTNIVVCGEIGISDLPEHIAFQTNQSYANRSLDMIMEEYEKKVLTKLLPKNATTEEKEEVAISLKVSRATLYRKLKKYGLY